jgi:hypothetical protein
MSGELSLDVTPRTPSGVTTMEDHGQVLSLFVMFFVCSWKRTRVSISCVAAQASLITICTRRGKEWRTVSLPNLCWVHFQKESKCTSWYLTVCSQSFPVPFQAEWSAVGAKIYTCDQIYIWKILWPRFTHRHFNHHSFIHPFILIWNPHYRDYQPVHLLITEIST